MDFASRSILLFRDSFETSSRRFRASLGACGALLANRRAPFTLKVHLPAHQAVLFAHGFDLFPPLTLSHTCAGYLILPCQGGHSSLVYQLVCTSPALRLYLLFTIPSDHLSFFHDLVILFCWPTILRFLMRTDPFLWLCFCRLTPQMRCLLCQTFLSQNASSLELGDFSSFWT